MASNENNIIESTDSLETIGEFKTAKNLFMFLLVVSLLLSQGLFWFANLGFVDDSGCFKKSVGNVSACFKKSCGSNAPKLEAEVVSVNVANPEAVNIVDTSVSESVDVQAPTDSSEVLADVEVQVDEVLADKTDESVVSSASGNNGWKLGGKAFTNIVKIVNFVMFFSVTMYTLILLFCLKVSLVGRLGGMAHISAAFLYALAMAVVIIPWQSVFSGIHVVGAMYLPCELMGWVEWQGQTSVLGKAVYYLRFTGMWFVAMLFFMASIARSVKWSRASLRRLGILG